MSEYWWMKYLFRFTPFLIKKNVIYTNIWYTYNHVTANRNYARLVVVYDDLHNSYTEQCSSSHITISLNLMYRTYVMVKKKFRPPGVYGIRFMLWNKTEVIRASFRQPNYLAMFTYVTESQLREAHLQPSQRSDDSTGASVVDYYGIWYNMMYAWRNRTSRARDVYTQDRVFLRYAKKNQLDGYAYKNHLYPPKNSHLLRSRHRWVSARLQDLQCFNGWDTAVLHWAIDTGSHIK